MWVWVGECEGWGVQEWVAECQRGFGFGCESVGMWGGCEWERVRVWVGVGGIV